MLQTSRPSPTSSQAHTFSLASTASFTYLSIPHVPFLTCARPLTSSPICLTALAYINIPCHLPDSCCNPVCPPHTMWHLSSILCTFHDLHSTFPYLPHGDMPEWGMGVQFFLQCLTLPPFTQQTGRQFCGSSKEKEYFWYPPVSFLQATKAGSQKSLPLPLLLFTMVIWFPC